MNIIQRIVLIVGAILLWMLMASADSDIRYYVISDTLYHYTVWHWQDALTRCLIVAISIAAIYFAVGKKKL
jgi:hypothetical protein